jgi:predicted metal-dependent peptidase
VRDIFAPSRSGYGAEHVVVAIDTSGSIYASPKTLEQFLGELGGVLDDVRPRRVSVIWCDAAVHRVDELEDAGDLHDLRCKKAPGGGGTSFVPVFEHIHRSGWFPEACLYLTDGDGTFPAQAPRFPVLWGSILRAKEHYPWGEVVQIPKIS